MVFAEATEGPSGRFLKSLRRAMELSLTTRGMNKPHSTTPVIPRGAFMGAFLDAHGSVISLPGEDLALFRTCDGSLFNLSSRNRDLRRLRTTSGS